MSLAIFQRKYPVLCRVLAGSSFDNDIEAASAMPVNEFKQALKNSGFALNELIGLVCGPIVAEWTEVEGGRLENNLAKVVSTVGLAETRRAYGAKLLIDDSNALQDVCYEVAATAVACDVFDPRSVELEKLLPGAASKNQQPKNSDIFGKFRGKPVRIEVTVLHQEPLYSVDLDLEEILKNAKTKAGFYVALRSPIQSEEDAERVRALIEQLDAHHAACGGASVEINGTQFDWRGGAYECAKGSFPVQRIRFVHAGDLRGTERTREISHPVTTRRITPRYLEEDFPNPPGVRGFVNALEGVDQEPVSKKIRDMIGRKVGQCEIGITNIIVFGNPRQVDEKEVQYALRGAPFGVGSMMTDRSGNRSAGEARLYRAAKAPFNPAHELDTDSDRANFIDPFRPISGVLHLRVGSYPMSRVIKNPNADVQMPNALAESLLKAASSRAPRRRFRSLRRGKELIYFVFPIAGLLMLLAYLLKRRTPSRGKQPFWYRS